MAKTILIVEDEKPLRNALAFKLKNEDFDILTATNGVEGLELAKEKKPDLILLDIMMPKMDGFQMTEKLREYEKVKNIIVDNQIPIIFLTNVGEEKGLGKGQQYGVYDYLVKANWNLDAIVKKIKDKLDI